MNYITVDKFKQWCQENNKRPNPKSEDPIERSFYSFLNSQPKPQREILRTWMRSHFPKKESPLKGLRKAEQINRILSVAHILQDPHGSLDAAGEVLGITRERVRQLINLHPELHYLRAEVRIAMRSEIIVEIAESVIELMKTGKNLGEACEVFDTSAATFHDTVRKNPSLQRCYLEFQQEEEQKKVKEAMKLVAEAKRLNVSLNRLTKGRVPNPISKLAYDLSENAPRHRRSVAETEELLLKVRSLVVDEKMTKSSALKSLCENTGHLMWLSRKTKERFQDDQVFNECALANRKHQYEHRHITKPANLDFSLKLTPETLERIRQFLLQHRTLKDIGEKLGICYSTVRNGILKVTQDDPALAELVKKDREDYKNSFYLRFKDRNTAYSYHKEVV